MRRDEEIVPFFREWYRQTLNNEGPEIAEARRAFMDSIDGIPKNQGTEIALTAGKWVDQSCSSAFIAGFRRACCILLPGESEKGEEHVSQ